MKYTLLGTALILATSTIASAEDSNPDALPTEPVTYEMRVGDVDVNCFDGKDHDDEFDQKAVVLDAEVTFIDNSPFVTDTQKFIAVTVQTGVKWVGLMNRESGKLGFESKKIVDYTRAEVKEQLGELNTVVKRDLVTANYVRGTIHGDIKIFVSYTKILQDTINCEGEGSFIMLPKT